MPILKAVCAKNGIAAMMQKYGNDIRIRMSSTDGTSLAEVKSTLEDHGQPVDIALYPNGQKLMVSGVKIGSGRVDGVVSFYDFSKNTAAEDSYQSGSFEYPDEIFPSVFYVSDSLAAAVGDGEIVTYTTGTVPVEKTVIDLDGEILSTFHDAEHIGVVKGSDSALDRYHMEVYTYAGKKTADVTFAGGYSEIRMDSGEILMNNTGHLMVFTTGGVARLDTDYEKQVGSFVKIPGFRKYAVLTNSSMDRIRIE